MAMKWLEGVRYGVGKLKSTSRDKPLDITKLTVDEIMLYHGAPNCGTLIIRAVEMVNRFVKIAEDNQRLSSELVDCQKSVIGLQEKLLEAKDEQLSAVTSTVSEKIDVVSQEVKDYSAAVKSGNVMGGATLSQSEVKSAVRTVLADRADEEGREGNVVMFGIDEEAGENVSEKVVSVLEVLGEKPKFSAVRIGQQRSDNAKRPIKVSFKNSSVTRQVLSKAPKLRSSDTHGSVYISPDRTPEQRILHRDLVIELKKRRTDEPDKTHFIRSGRVETK